MMPRIQATPRTILAASAALLSMLWLLRRQRSKHKGKPLPGPKGLPLVGVTNKMRDFSKAHHLISDWVKQYGPVFTFKTITTTFVMVANYEAIHEVCVKKGLIFGGRQINARTAIVTNRTGILFSTEPNDTWKNLRKTSHKHLKQFGDGLSRLESVITELACDMFEKFQVVAERKEEIDPKQAVFDAALCSIAFLITGKRTQPGDTIVEKMRLYESELLKCMSTVASPKIIMLDYFPSLKWLGMDIYKKMMEVLQLEKEIWDEVKELNASTPELGSLCKVLMTHAVSSTEKSSTGSYDENDASKTSVNLLFAGVTTTSNTFYGAINILAHHPEIQEKIIEEMEKICPSTEVTLTDRPTLPYTRAFLLELLRYTSVVPLSVPHKAMQDDTIQGYAVSKGSRITINIWHLHHDPEFWKNPEEFLPDRFLDDEGEVVPADHPNRKHLMPFGAGPRVCLGESLALSRLFLWITMFVRRFKVFPGKSNMKSSADARNFTNVGVLQPCSYRVTLEQRE